MSPGKGKKKKSKQFLSKGKMEELEREKPNFHRKGAASMLPLVKF